LLPFVIEPLFWQTYWFRGLVVFGVLGTIAAFGWRRVRLTEQRRAAQELFSRQLLESQEAERRRIAAELHDGLGQNLVLVKNLAAMDQLGDGHREKTAPRAAEIAAAIDTEFANSPAETKAETEGAMFQGFAQQIGDIATIVKAIHAAVFFTILLVAGNTMAQSVRERTQELGLLKAVGFSNELVLAVVLCESLAITVLGGMLGLLLGWLMVTGLGQAGFIRQFFPVFFVSALDLIIGAALAITLGFVAGILPAIQAMRLRLAEALRREG